MKMLTDKQVMWLVVLLNVLCLATMGAGYYYSSEQLAPDPDNGEVLLTNGEESVWGTVVGSEQNIWTTLYADTGGPEDPATTDSKLRFEGGPNINTALVTGTYPAQINLQISLDNDISVSTVEADISGTLQSLIFPDGSANTTTFEQPATSVDNIFWWWDAAPTAGQLPYISAQDLGTGAWKWGWMAVPAVTNSFETINCSTGTDPVADSATDTLALTGGTGITVTGDSATDTATVACTLTGNATHTGDVTGATALTITQNAPIARAYSSAGQLNLVNNTWTIITLDTENYDPSTKFAANRFTPTVAGYYMVSATITLTNVITDKNYNGALYFNGAGAAYFSTNPGFAALTSLSLNNIMYFDTDDYVELYIRSISGGNTVDVNGGTGDTFMCCYRLY